MAARFAFPVTLKPEPSGGFVVRFPDLPEIVTQGEDRVEAMAHAADALEEAFAGRIHRGVPMPVPSPAAGRPLVALPPIMAAKAALVVALRDSGTTQQDLARRLAVDEKEVRRLLDPRHPSKMPRLERALAVFGKALELRVIDRVA